MEGCSSADDCLAGETCAPGGTCVSNAFVPGAASVDEVDPSLGLNLDPCESIADCQNPRNCVQFVSGEFGQCSGPNCFCVRPDPSCISASECSEGESCTQREGSNNAICISETAIINGDATDEEIEGIPDGAPELPPMSDMTPTEPAPDAPTDTGMGTSAPTTSETSDSETPDAPAVIPVPLPADSTPDGDEPAPAEPAPAEPAPAEPAPEEPAPAEPAPAEPAPAEPAPAEPAPEEPAPAEPAPAEPAPGEPEEPAPAEPAPAEPAPGEPEEPAPAEPAPGEPTAPEGTEPEQADREPAILLPGADGADVSPDTEEGEDLVPSDTDVDVGPTITDEEDGEMLPSPDDDLIEPGVSSTPDVELDDELGPTPTPEDVICIGEHHLVHMPHDELLYSSNRVARVLCDENNSCATPGHIVMYNDKPMMMSSYCSKATCAPKIMKVNSPRYRRATRVNSHTEGLSFTAFAARYETTAEEHLLRTFVRMGL
ncbi:hypothetical protein FGB62_19g046 [Gracilaria domingensis]|nr:hypothetical protein FGB62_19g046 [Gracilaria domingensis]